MNNTFLSELEHVINKYSVENQSNTPDFLLAEYLRGCLDAYNQAVLARDKWYGVHLEPANKYFIKQDD
jgi:hypothetical protein